MEEKKDFGKFVSTCRKAKGLTQRELAEELCVTESAVSKWERNVSYPDISLITPLCQVLDITEHELINASEDHAQHKLEREARHYRIISGTYKWFFYIGYGITIVISLIVDIASGGGLSEWFYILVASLLLGFSLTSVPSLVSEHRGLWTAGSFVAALTILLGVCVICFHADWFFIAWTAVMFGLCVVLLPFIHRGLTLPEPMGHNRGLCCFVVDTIMLFALIVAVGIGTDYFVPALIVAGYWSVLPWCFLIVCRYVNVGSAFKTAILCAVSGVLLAFGAPVTSKAIDGVWSIPAVDFSNWAECINGNVMVLILAVPLAMACVSLAIAIMKAQRQ